jgi:hypothetical protein
MHRLDGRLPPQQLLDLASHHLQAHRFLDLGFGGPSARGLATDVDQ